jgi:hypothetical protein
MALRSLIVDALLRTEIALAATFGGRAEGNELLLVSMDIISIPRYIRVDTQNKKFHLPAMLSMPRVCRIGVGT